MLLYTCTNPCFVNSLLRSSYFYNYIQIQNQGRFKTKLRLMQWCRPIFPQLLRMHSTLGEHAQRFSEVLT